MNTHAPIAVAITTITPELARAWLEKNRDNRPFRRATADAYKAQLTAGQYVMTHQGVAFSRDGVLLDGQHRLTAISEMPAGFSIQMMVVTGLPPEAAEGMDRGLSRTVSDILKIPPGLAAVGRMAFMLNHPELRVSASPQTLRPYITGVTDTYERLVDAAPRSSKVWSSAGVRLACVLRALHRPADEQYVFSQYAALTAARFDGMSTVTQTLYRQQLARRPVPLELFCRAYYALDPRRAPQEALLIRDPSNIYAEARSIIRAHVVPQLYATEYIPAARRAKRRDVAGDLDLIPQSHHRGVL